MAQPQIISRLKGTYESLFYFGTKASQTILKSVNGAVVHLRNNNDTAYVDLAAKQLRIQGTNETNAVVLAAPNSLGNTVTLTMPDGVGSAGYVWTSLGDGTTEWASVASGADTTLDAIFSEASSTITLLASPAANTVIKQVKVIVDAAASGNTPTLAVGVSSDTDAYVAAGENDLKAVGEYIIDMSVDVGASPEDVIVTVAPSGQTFSGRVYITYTEP